MIYSGHDVRMPIDAEIEGVHVLRECSFDILDGQNNKIKHKKRHINIVKRHHHKNNVHCAWYIFYQNIHF